MRGIRQVILYYVLLSKRFLKKLSFILLLCAIPVLALCLRNVSEQDSGMIRIALCMEDPEDETVRALVEELTNANSIMRCFPVEKEAEARKMVVRGDVDAAWIFQKDFMGKIKEMVANGMKGDGPILVVEQEDNIVLQLARIKLFGVLYPSLSYALFQDFAYSDLGVEATEEELRSYYELFEKKDDLFRFAYSGSKENPVAQSNYMTAPLRGMLAILIILCGFAADMFFLQDEAGGVLDAFSLKTRRRSAYIYQLAAMVPAAVAVLTALFLLGDFTGAAGELLLMILYLADCMVFCNLIRCLSGTARCLGAGIPILTLGMLVICPVFFNLRQLRAVQNLLPPYYYLSAAHTGPGSHEITSMALFAVIGAAMSILAEKVCLILKRS